jgi:hypothetical protein
VSRAVKKFVQFHQREPRRSGSFASSLVIPDAAICVGAAKNVLYSSDKLNPETSEDEGWIDYIHEHDAGVKVYRCDRAAKGLGDLVTVPSWLRRTTELTWLGDCLGFAYTDYDGKEHEAKGQGLLPELFTTPNGKALLVIQNKRTLCALIWGGRLGVEPRGIVH